MYPITSILSFIYVSTVTCWRGRDSSVGIATRYGLDGPGIESRWGARFSVPVQTGRRAHPASCTVGTGTFPGVKRPGCGVVHPPPSSAEVEGRVELYICSPSGSSWPLLGRTLPLPLLSPVGSVSMCAIYQRMLWNLPPPPPPLSGQISARKTGIVPRNTDTKMFLCLSVINSHIITPALSLKMSHTWQCHYSKHCSKTYPPQHKGVCCVFFSFLDPQFKGRCRSPVAALPKG